jgi:hypothetical protein
VGKGRRKFGVILWTKFLPFSLLSLRFGKDNKGKDKLAFF